MWMSKTHSFFCGSGVKSGKIEWTVFTEKSNSKDVSELRGILLFKLTHIMFYHKIKLMVINMTEWRRCHDY